MQSTSVLLKLVVADFAGVLQEIFGQVKAVAAGYYHQCYIASDLTVGCTGDNNVGQRNVPQDLTALDIAAGVNHTCAIKASDQNLACWGLNSSGQTTVPNDLAKVKKVSLGDKHTHVLSIQAMSFIAGSK